MYSIAFEKGVITVFYDFYGSWSVWFGLSIACFIFIAPLYLRIFIKKEWYIALFAILMTIIFILGALIFLNKTESQFKDFTPEKWKQYPRQRHLMIEDLKFKHNIIGMNSDEVKSILGAPDIIYETRFSYSFEYGYIDIFFEDNKVRNIEIIN